MDAALTEAVEAVGSESLTPGPSPLAYPDSTHVEHLSSVPPGLDTGRSATRPTPSTAGPAPTFTDPASSAQLDLVHRATDSDPSELPSLTQASSTYSAVSPGNCVPSLTSTATDSTHKPMPSTLTPTGSVPNATDPVQATPSPTHATPSLTHTTISLTHTTVSPAHSTPSPTHTTPSPTHTTVGPSCTTPSPTTVTPGPSHSATSPTGKTGMSTTHTTTSHTTNAVGPVQTTTSPISTTESPAPSTDLATISSSSADPLLPGTEPLPCSHPASTPSTHTDPTAPCTSHQSLACSDPKSLTSPAPNSPEQILKSPSSSPSSIVPAPQHSEPGLATAAQAPVPEAAGGAGDKRLEEALGTLMAALDDYRGQFPELQGLEQEVTRLESLLMVRRLGRAGLRQHRESCQPAAVTLTPCTISRDKA